MTLLLDVAPPLGAGFEIFAGAGFLLVFAGIAFIAFKLLKKTVKMAFRMAIVGIILLVAIAGSIYFFYSGSSSKTDRPTPRPAATR